MKRRYKMLQPYDEMHISLVIHAFLAFPAKPECIWDIGSGPGKLLIEAKLRYGKVKLMAIDNAPEYEAVMQENMARYEVASDAIQFVNRDVISADLSDLPAPDAIYFSCAGTPEQDLFAKLWGYLKPGGTMAAVGTTYYEGPVSVRSLERVKQAQQTYGGTLTPVEYYYTDPAPNQKPVFNSVLFWSAQKPV